MEIINIIYIDYKYKHVIKMLTNDELDELIKHHINQTFYSSSVALKTVRRLNCNYIDSFYLSRMITNYIVSNTNIYGVWK